VRSRDRLGDRREGPVVLSGELEALVENGDLEPSSAVLTSEDAAGRRKPGSLVVPRTSATDRPLG